MAKQQLEAMLAIEKSSYSKHSIASHPKRRIIADYLNKLTDDERIPDDIFALTMHLFDRFVSQTHSTDHSCQLIALSCYHLSKKLRTNMSVNNENEQISSILSNENYSDEEIFNTEQMICNTLEWDLASFVPHDYVQFFLPLDNQPQIRLHVHILLSIAICELNTLTILPSVLACACIRAAIKGLCLKSLHHLDELIFKRIDCQKSELIQIQCMIEQFFQSCLQTITPSPRRRCLAPIDASPQQRTKVK